MTKKYISGFLKTFLLFLTPFFCAKTSFCSKEQEYTQSAREFLFPLHEATEAGDIDRIRVLLSRGFAVEERDGTQQTALHVAVKNNNLQAVECLVRHGALVNTQNSAGKTPFHIACENGHDEIFTYLFSLGPDMIAQDKNGMSPLHYISENGHTGIIRFLIGTFASQGINHKNSEGYTALHLAVKNGHIEVVRCLLRAGADIEARATLYEEPVDCDDLFEGKTALHLACKNDHTEIVKLLIQHGAVADVWDHDEDERATPLYYAIENCNLIIVQLLIEAGSRTHGIGPSYEEHALHYAAMGKNPAIIAFFIQETPEDIDCPDAEENTPLHWAALYGCPQNAPLLFNAGAQVKLNKYKQTPLEFLLAGLPETAACSNYQKYREKRFPIAKFFIELDIDNSPRTTALLDKFYPEHRKWLAERKQFVKTLLEDTHQLPRDIAGLLHEFVFTVEKKRKRDAEIDQESAKKSRNS